MFTDVFIYVHNIRNIEYFSGYKLWIYIYNIENRYCTHAQIREIETVQQGAARTFSLDCKWSWKLLLQYKRYMLDTGITICVNEQLQNFIQVEKNIGSCCY